MRPEHFTPPPVARAVGSSLSTPVGPTTRARMESSKFTFRMSSVGLKVRAASSAALNEVLVEIATAPHAGEPIFLSSIRLSALAARRFAAELTAAATELEEQYK